MTKIIYTLNQKVRFSLGQIVATPGAIEALNEADQGFLEFLSRHVTGDWGDICKDDAAENECALKEGFRLLSAYRTRLGVKFWIITEADRSVTTLLLPDEY